MPRFVSMIPVPHFDYHEVVWWSRERRDQWDTLQFRVFGMTQRGPAPRTRWAVLHLINVHSNKQTKLCLTPEEAVRVAGDLLMASGKTIAHLEAYVLEQEILAEQKAAEDHANGVQRESGQG